jgi:uncharacterized membrane protein YczE
VFEGEFMVKKIKRISMALLGVALCGVCVGIFNKAALGADPFTMFVTGIGKLFGLGYGNVYVAVTGILLIVVFIVDKHYIGIATIFNLFIIGYVAEFTMLVIDLFYTEGNILIRLGMLLFSLVLLCFAAALYFTADLGVSSYDAIAIILSKKTPIQFRLCRIGTDLICVIIGFLCGTTVGIGTLMTAFFMGPIIQWFKDHITEPYLNGKDN